MADAQETRKGESSVQEEMRVRLISQEERYDESAEGGIREDRFMVYVTTFVVAFGYYAFGSCLGYSSPTQFAIREDVHLSLTEYSMFGSILTFGAMIGAITCGKIADYIGRKLTMILSSGFCMAGWLSIYFAQEAILLDIGRFATGYGMGVSSYVIPVFIAEIAPKDLRGTLTMFCGVVLYTGVCVSFIIGTMLTWRALALTGIIPCALLIFGLFIIPESPRWLAKQGNEKEFEASLRRLRGKNADISEEATEIQEDIENLGKLPKANLFDLLRKRYLGSVKIGVGLMVFQQLGGINGICFYVSSIFQSSGFPADVGTISFAILQVITSTLGGILIDRSGRKPLLVVPFICQWAVAAHQLQNTIFTLHTIQDVNKMRLPRAGFWSRIGPRVPTNWEFILFEGAWTCTWGSSCSSSNGHTDAGAFSIGMGEIPWLVISEIFPVNIKGVAGSLAALVHWSGALVCTLTFNSLMSWSSYGTFTLYAAINALAIVFVIKVVPETKGRTLEQIQAALGSSI